MFISILALVFSGIATLTSIAAIVVTIVHKKGDKKHSFYSSFEEKISNVLFGSLPKALNSFIDKNRRKINKDKYSKIDICFNELYQSIGCLNYLDENDYASLYKSISDLEETLMILKEKGFEEARLTKVEELTKGLYKSFKDFCLNH